MKLMVLLSSYNGERYIREQLDSILAQTQEGIRILVRDDGSSDGTPEILKEYDRADLLDWCGGHNVGPSRSFWKLLRNCPAADYYAFSDQDDVWDPDKLETAVSSLVKEQSGGPLLYCSDVRVADASLHVTSPHMIRQGLPADYPHVLIKSPAPGCTFVFNHAAMEFLRRYDAEKLGLDLYDWTVCQIIACFGRVVFDPHSHMSYRQHGDNVIGAGAGVCRERLKKTAGFLFGDLRNRRERNARRLERAFRGEMSRRNRVLTADFAHYRENSRRRERMLNSRVLRFPGFDYRMFRLLIRLGRL